MMLENQCECRTLLLLYSQSEKENLSVFNFIPLQAKKEDIDSIVQVKN